MKKLSIYAAGLMIAGLFISLSLFAQTVLHSESGNLKTDQYSEQMKIFPNPSNGKFQLVMEYDGQEKITARVYDITGKLFKDISEELVIGESKVTAKVDLQVPRTGIYFLRIEIGNGTFAKKIIIR